MRIPSDTALALRRDRPTTKDNRVNASNPKAYGDLVQAGIMFVVSGFASGPEASFRFTDEGWARRREFVGSDADTTARSPRRTSSAVRIP